MHQLNQDNQKVGGLRGAVIALLTSLYPLYVVLSSITTVIVIGTLVVWGIKLIISGSWLLGLAMVVIGVPLVLANTQTLGAAAIVTLILWIVSLIAGWQLFVGNVFIVLLMLMTIMSVVFSLLFWVGLSVLMLITSLRDKSKQS